MNLRPLATIDGATLSLQIDPEAEFGGHPVSLDLTATTTTSGRHDASTHRHRSHRRRLGAPRT